MAIRKAPKTPTIPAHIKGPIRGWARQVMADFDLEPHHVLLLTKACEAHMRGDQARRQLDRDGLTVMGKQGLRSHPCVAIERDSRLSFARLVRELALDANAPDDPRPPRIAGAYVGDRRHAA
jgi:phage terminase small subunit